MKKSLAVLTMLLFTIATTFAQSAKYQKSMEANIAMLDTAKGTEDVASVAATFERIGDAEKNQWLPYYYAALAVIRTGYENEKANKDEVGNKADELLSKAEALEPKSADIAVLKAMAATLHMLVDPMNRWQKYGTMQREAIENAKQFDENNPRIYLFEGQNVFHTPPQFGGGKDKAKPLLEKSIALFKTYQPASVLHPHWGEKQAQQMLEMCNSK